MRKEVAYRGRYGLVRLAWLLEFGEWLAVGEYSHGLVDQILVHINLPNIMSVQPLIVKEAVREPHD